MWRCEVSEVSKLKNSRQFFLLRGLSAFVSTDKNMFENTSAVRNLLQEFNDAADYSVEVVVLQEPNDIRIIVNDVYTNEEVEIIIV